MTDNTIGNGSILQRLKQVRTRISRACEAAGRTPQSVHLLAVSKGHGADAIRAAVRCGQQEFGENYLQEALGKMEALADERIRWHFIGPIQSNKTRDIAARFHCVQSLDRAKIARRLSEQRPPHMPPLDVLVQVNINDEASKSGIEAEQAQTLCETVTVLPRLRLRGLMAIPEHTEDPALQRRNFHRMFTLFQDLANAGLALDTLSMGMSGDLEAAVAEGATLVRIGTAIFGPRHYA